MRIAVPIIAVGVALALAIGATVILGGLITSTICEYVVYLGLFWRFSGGAAKRLALQVQE